MDEVTSEGLRNEEVAERLSTRVLERNGTKILCRSYGWPQSRQKAHFRTIGANEEPGRPSKEVNLRMSLTLFSYVDAYVPTL